MLNVHHLELFYYAARHRGIVAACRHIPYGVQQPAVSAQLIKLEGDLNVKLFERRPFRLTEAGQGLYDFISPFFGGLDDVEMLIRGKHATRLRIAGPTQVMRDHLPEMLRSLRQRFAGLRVRLIEADQKAAETAVSQGEAELGISVLESTPPQGMRSVILLKLPLALIVPASSKYRRAEEALRDGPAGKIELISISAHERLSKLFADELRRRGKAWPISMEVSSTDLVGQYVSHNLGVGVSILAPGAPVHPGARSLPLPGFPPLPIGAFWKGRLAAIPQAFLDALIERGQRINEQVKKLLPG